MTDSSTGQPGFTASSAKWPARTTIVVIAAILVVAAFLAGFLPTYLNGQRLAGELRDARQESSMAELRDLAGLLYLQASQRDYGLAAGTSTRFFERTREVANQTPDSSRKRSLEDLLSVRDQVTSELAKGEPGVMSDLQALFVRTREATISDIATLRSEQHQARE